MVLENPGRGRCGVGCRRALCRLRFGESAGALGPGFPSPKAPSNIAGSRQRIGTLAEFLRMDCGDGAALAKKGGCYPDGLASAPRRGHAVCVHPTLFGEQGAGRVDPIWYANTPCRIGRTTPGRLHGVCFEGPRRLPHRTPGRGYYPHGGAPRRKPCHNPRGRASRHTQSGPQAQHGLRFQNHASTGAGIGPALGESTFTSRSRHPNGATRTNGATQTPLCLPGRSPFAHPSKTSLSRKAHL